MIHALLFAAAVAAPDAGATRDEGRAVAQHVQRFYQRAADFTARFEQTSTYPTFGNVKKASGKLFLKKPDLLRWEYDDGRLIVLDGKSLWSWNAEDKEATVKHGFGSREVPPEFAFLFGKGTLLDRFTAREIPLPEGLPQGVAVELFPKHPSAEVQKLVLVASPEGEVRASIVTNSQGDTNQLVFSGVRTNVKLPDSLFHFEPPAGAHVSELK